MARQNLLGVGGSEVREEYVDPVGIRGRSCMSQSFG